MKSDASEVARVLVGIDVGGTFTDFVFLVDGRLDLHKVATTPHDQSEAILAGLRARGIREADIVHGMTVATNALLERRGASTALLTTAGFADVLVIGRQNRPHIYQLQQARPVSLVADGWRLEAPERVDSTGQVLQPLDEAVLRDLANRLSASDVESLAIVFLFSFLNPAHERRAAQIIRDRLPELPISLSSDVLPEYREYERTATTVINAYVQPLVARYLERLESALADARIRIMQSNGGAIGLQQATHQAARVVLSGPAGGVVGAFAVAQQAMDSGSPNLITFDMGGTSTDVALCPGEIPTTAESVITDLPLRLPVIDIHTVGAGGGSIAYLDAAGGLHVGPRSAGAIPGPACYGRGGAEPTVTDANLVLGRLDPGGFLGGRGELRLDAQAAHDVMARLGERLGMGVQEAALGVVKIANATMERALRRVSVERGHDPRHFVLLPFGGAGPLHACDLASALNIQQLLIPPIPGVLSAYGMLVADISIDASQTVLGDLENLAEAMEPLVQTLAELNAKVKAILRAEGVSNPQIDAAIDLRYKGQSYELTVPLALPLAPASLSDAAAAFHRAHERRYGYAMAGETVESVNLRVAGSAPGARPSLPAFPLEAEDANAARLADKPIWFTAGAPLSAARYSRDLLRPGNRFDGPAIVLQFDATLVVAPGWRARVDEFNNIWLTH